MANRSSSPFTGIALILSIFSLGISLWTVWKGRTTTEETPGTCGVTANKLTIEQVEAALLAKPDMLVKAMTALQEGKKQKAKEETKEGIIKQDKNLFHNEKDPVSGNPKGDVSIVSFFDYRCGYCRRAYGVLEELIKADDKVKIIYKELPIFGEDSPMSKAALAAKRQGKYADFHKALMNSSGTLNMDELKTLAEKLGLNVAQFEKDMADESIMAEIKANMELGQALGISSTPTFILTGGDMQSGLIETADFRKLVENARNTK